MKKHAFKLLLCAFLISALVAVGMAQRSNMNDGRTFWQKNVVVFDTLTAPTISGVTAFTATTVNATTANITTANIGTANTTTSLVVTGIITDGTVTTLGSTTAVIVTLTGTSADIDTIVSDTNNTTASTIATANVTTLSVATIFTNNGIYIEPETAVSVTSPTVTVTAAGAVLISVTADVSMTGLVINGGTTGQVLVVRGTADGQTVQLDDGTSYTLDGNATLGLGDFITLRCVDGGVAVSAWEETNRSLN